jgi:hypothetical protein
MTAKRKTPTKHTPEWTKTVNPKAFASLDAGPAHVESMIHVYWSGYGDARDARDGGMGHRMMRDKVTASLGLDHAVEPGFTEDEMQAITFAAKLAALKCLGARRHDHRPRCTQDLARIIGCTCGWQRPSGTADSDNAFSTHVAHARRAKGAPR